MRTYYWLLLAGLLAGTASCCSPPGEGSRARTRDFGMEVQAHRAPNGHYLLTIYLTNRGTHRLSIDANCLPWRPYGMTLVLVAEDAYSSILERSHVIADSTPNAMATIEPGQTMRGEVDLSEIYPELNAAVRKEEVSVFWSYGLIPALPAPNRRVGGWLCLPRAGAGKDRK